MDKTLARGLASQMMFQHGLHSWRCIMKNLKNRLGQCEYKTKCIVLSEFYVENNSESVIRDVILHEIAHALVGPGHGHDEVWKAMACRIGADPKSCVKVTARPAGRYQAGCPKCKRLYHMYRKPKSTRIHWCPTCGSQQGRLKFIFACAV